jgi:hypothetical protein
LVCGFPSGGTDLLRSILNAHPEIYLNGEMPFLHHLPALGYRADRVFQTTSEVEGFQRLVSDLDVNHALENAEAPAEALVGMTVPEALRCLFAHRGSAVWGNKTPQNTEHLPSLDLLFPDARFIIIHRDVRDVCLSWRRKWGRHPFTCSHRWQERMGAVRASASEVAAGKTLFLGFENLLSQSRRETERLCRFLGLSWSPRMLEHHRSVSRVMDGKINYGEPIRPENQGKWRWGLKAREIRRIEEIAFHTMKAYEYEPSLAVTNRPLGRLSRAWGHVWDLAAYLLVGNRASGRNSVGARLRRLGLELKKRSLKRRAGHGV